MRSTDDPPASTAEGVCLAIERVGVEPHSLPPCGPDFNPGEMVASALKANLPAKAERAYSLLRGAEGSAILRFKSDECARDFAAVRREPD